MKFQIGLAKNVVLGIWWEKLYIIPRVSFWGWKICCIQWLKFGIFFDLRKDFKTE